MTLMRDPRPRSRFPSPAVANGVLYVSSGNLFAFGL
jgi:hypothetical protein